MPVMYYILLANQVIIMSTVFFGVRLLFRIVNSSAIWLRAIPEMKQTLERLDKLAVEFDRVLKSSEYRRWSEVRDGEHAKRSAH